jgi:hypothetical protein
MVTVLRLVTYILVSPTACYDLYTINIPWSVAYAPGAANQYQSACGFGKDTSNPLATYYNGSITISYSDQVQIIDDFRSINLTRSSSNTLQFQVGLPTQTSAVISPVLSSDIRLIRSVINQTYNPIGEHLTLTLYTAVQHPFVILDGFHAAVPVEVQFLSVLKIIRNID